MREISIIIPVYNRKKYLRECIESVLAQRFKDFEVWLIDDGSTDGSAGLCDEWQQADRRIHVLHTPNRGVTQARKLGVEHATGRWVMFMDSDDTLPADALSRLMHATSADTDIVLGFCRHTRLWGRKHLSAVRYRKKLIVGRHNISAPWGRLFRRSLFSEATFSQPRSIIMGEDTLMNLRLSFASDKPVRLVGDAAVYFYRQSDEGITHIFRNSADYEHLFHRERMLSIPTSEHARYMPAMLQRRLRMLRRLLRQAQREGKVEELESSPFVKEIIRDIHQAHYFCFRYPHFQVWRFLTRTELNYLSILLPRSVNRTFAFLIPLPSKQDGNRPTW